MRIAYYTSFSKDRNDPSGDALCVIAGQFVY